MSATGENIRKARKAKGLTQKDLARKVGLSEPAIRLYELGKRRPKDPILKQIADALDVEPEGLRGYDVSSAREALAMLFSLEGDFGIRPVILDGGVAVAVEQDSPSSQKLVRAIKVWADQLEQLEDGQITQQQYDAWKASFEL